MKYQLQFVDMEEVTTNFNKLTLAENIRLPDTAYLMTILALSSRYDKLLQPNSPRIGTEIKEERTQGNSLRGLRCFQ